MRLVDLDPRWLMLDGRRVGFAFRCPIKATTEWMTCFAEALPSKVQRRLTEEMFGEDNCHTVQTCKEGIAWTFTPVIAEADFGSLSIQPSLDGSPGGNWHGFITNGEIVGGL